MMEIDSFIQLVEAYEITEKFEEFFRMVTGRTFSLEEEWDVSGKLYEVMRENSRYAGLTDDDSENELWAIVNAINISAEDKVFLLTGINPNNTDGYTIW